MTTIELFNSLTEGQKLEFEKDTKDFIEKMAKSGNIHFDKLHEVNSNMRLGHEVFLNVTFHFVANEEGKISGIISNIHKFNNLDEYLDSIIEANRINDSEWTSLK